MKISYNWLKWYIPEAPEAEKLADIFTYHLAEVESLEKNSDGDTILDIKILPNRAHDLLSHLGIAREIASLLNIKLVDPTAKYKIPESKPTKLIKTVETSKCRRYMGRVVRNVKIGPSPEWVVKHLEAIGQRSINNIVDATNIVMFNCGQPAHVFDLSKVKDLKLKVRNAENGEKITLLGGGEKELNDTMMIIADDYGNPLDIAGIKGGKYAELTNDTTEIILECANFDPTSVRKTAQALSIFTDAKKRFENDLSPELAAYGMRELSALIFEMCPEAVFEDIVDVYPKKQEIQKLSFRTEKISKILGIEVSPEEIKEILKRYNIDYKEEKGVFEIKVPTMRLDLNIEEDAAEEIGRILGFDRLKNNIPKVDFKPKQNELYAKIVWARNKLLAEGYSEVMTSSFKNNGEVSVLASASDKNFLRTNLTDGLKESIRLNQTNAPLLGGDIIKVFEIGTIFNKNGEEMRIAYGDKKEVKEVKLEEFCKDFSFSNLSEGAPNTGNFPTTIDGFSVTTGLPFKLININFKNWPLFPFIARDVAVWVPENVKSEEVLKVIKENAGDVVIKGPELFDEFKKDGKISYAFRIVFQSYDRTLTDAEINQIMDNISKKITENNGWQVR
ncbi:MAG: phenylalanine--tRNA ligase subunit beta [Minisyncoccia bacterium]